SARCSGLNAAINPIPWLGCSTAIATCPGRFRLPEAVDLDLGPGQVSGLQRFSSGKKKLRDEEDLSVGRETVRRERPTCSAKHSSVTVAAHLAQLNDPGAPAEALAELYPGLKNPEIQRSSARSRREPVTSKRLDPRWVAEHNCALARLWFSARKPCPCPRQEELAKFPQPLGRLRHER